MLNVDICNPVPAGMPGAWEMLKNRLSVTCLRPVSHNFEPGQDLEAAQPATSVTDATPALPASSTHSPVGSPQSQFVRSKSNIVLLLR